MYKKEPQSQGTSKHYVQKYLFLVLLVPIFIISFRLFIQQGAIINGDFPSFEVSDHSFERLWLWIDKGSYSGFENLARFPMIGIWAFLSLLSVSFEASTKIMIILGFSLCSFSFYFSFFYLLKNKIQGITELKLSIALIIGSIFYAYNVWSFNRIDHYYLWIGYSILPIFFVSLVFSFQRFKFKYIIIAALTSIIASSTPHMVIFYGIILTITFLSFFVYYLSKRKFKPLLYSTATLVSLFSLFVVVNLYWILPYVLSSVTSSSELIAPTYVLNLEITDVLSRDNDFFNTLTLTADWINFGVNYEPSPPTSILHSLWLFTIYLFPVLAILSFILWVKKIKYSLILFVFFVIGFVLAMGTNIRIDYFSILFSTPILGKIAWVFRDPDKWSFLIAFSYSFFITLFSVFIFKLFSNRSKNIIVSSIYIVIIIGSIAIFAYPVYNYTMDEIYNSIKLPEDFDNLNNYLSTLDTQKVFFMPYSATPPYWSLNHGIIGPNQPGIYQLESDLPSNQIFYPVQQNYYNYFTQLIQNNQTKEGISNYIYPFGTSYLIYHNDTISEDDLSFSNKVYTLSDLQHDKNIGFFDVFKLPKNQSSSIDIMNTNNNIGVVQGLDKLSLLNKIKSFSSTNSSVLFLDQNPSQNISSLNYFNNIIMEPSFLGLVFPFMPNDYFVSPFEYTFHNDHSLFWSRVNAIDSLHGEFHPYLQPVGIDNWDLDYGKGIVITQASGVKLDIPIKIDKDDQYDLFIRYLENFRGGNIKIFLDDDLINEINTQGTDNNDKFVWKKIWSGNLTKGTHKLTIENVNGFNAINTFAVVPHSQFEQSMSAVMDKTSEMNIIYLMDQADFDSFGNSTNSILVPLFDTTISNNTMTMTPNKINNTTAGTVMFNGTLNTPDNVDSLRLNFENKYKPFSPENSGNDTQTTNPIRSIDLIPTSQKTVYSEDYENATNPFELFGDELYSENLEENYPIAGNSSLKVNVNQSTPDSMNTWNILQTDYIPIGDDTNLKFKSKVKAFDMNDFHPEVHFYDLNYNLISENPVSEPINGSFEKEYAIDIVPPRNTEFIQVAFLFLPNANSKSTFYLDDTEVTEIIPRIHLNNLGYTDEYYADMHRESLIQNNTDGNASSSTSLVQTRSIPVVNNASYGYNIKVNDENIDSIKSYALFSESNQSNMTSSTTNTTTTAINATADTGTETMNTIMDNSSMGYTLQKDIDIIKSGSYSFDFQFYDNSTGDLKDEPVKLVIDGVERDYQSLSNNESNHNSSSNSSLTSDNTFSIGSTVYLPKGTHQIKLTMPDPKTKLDIALIYTINSNENADTNDAYSSSTSSLPFSDQSIPAYLSNYSKINPTKHIIKIDNATKPFVLSFSETYDPLWKASIVGNDPQSQKEIDNVPIFSIVNGFLINKTGSFDIVLEYEPQAWFYTGLTISIIVLLILAATATIYYYKTSKTKPIP